MDIDDLIVRRALDAMKVLLRHPNNHAAQYVAQLSAAKLADCLPERETAATGRLIPGADVINERVQEMLASGDAKDRETVIAAFDDFLVTHAQEREIELPSAPLVLKDAPPLFVVHNIPVYSSDLTGSEDCRVTVCARLEEYVFPCRQHLRAVASVCPDVVYALVNSPV